MAFIGKQKDQNQYGKLMGMIAPEATPTKRIGAEAPTGATTAGPTAGKKAAEFTQTAAGSPGSVFKRQLGGADIGGITRLAEQPLLREFGQEAGRLAQEGVKYKQTAKEQLGKLPQFTAKTPEEQMALANRLAAGQDTETAKRILEQGDIEIPEFTTAPVQEFTPQKALRGGTVESLIRKEAQGPYTTGMAGLDALLFAKKGGAGQLAQRGMGLRTAAQTAADIMQGKTSGVIPEAVSGILAGAGITGGLKGEAEKQAKEFVESQKAGLKETIGKGISSREEAIRGAPAGQKSRIQTEQERVAQEFADQEQRMVEARQAYAQMQQDRLRDTVLNEMMNQLATEDRLRQERAAQGVQGNVQIQLRGPEAYRQQALSDPRYTAALERANLLAAPGLQLSQITRGQGVPTVGLENVMSETEAAEYNRLQELIGGKPITRAATAKPIAGYGATYDITPMKQFFENLFKQDFISDRPREEAPAIPTTPVAFPAPQAARPTPQAVAAFGGTSGIANITAAMEAIARGRKQPTLQQTMQSTMGGSEPSLNWRR